MKNNKILRWIYAIISLVAVLPVIAIDVARDSFRMNFVSFLPYMLMITIQVAAPIAIPILSFAKVILQKSVPASFSIMINAGALVILAGMAAVFYNVNGFATFVTNYYAAVYLFVLHLCSLVYDLFTAKNRMP